MLILSKIKRVSAACLAVLITLTAFGLSENEKTVTINAAQAPSVYEKQLKDLEDKQQKLQNKIDETDDNINNQQEKLNNVAEQLEIITEKIKISEKYSKEIEKDICKIDDQMRKNQYDLSNQEDDIKKGVNEFMSRVRSMYLAGTDSYSEILINSSDFYDVLMRMELIKRVAAHDNETIDGLIKQKEKIDLTKSDLKKQKENLLSESKKYSEEQKKLSDEYEKLTSMQNEYGESIAKLENNKNELQSEVNNLIQEYEAKTATASKTTKAKATTTKKTASNTNKSKSTTTTKKYSATKKPNTTTPKTTTKKTTTNTPEPTPTPSTGDYDTKINILMTTAKSMVGGSYVWGGTSPNATDCSGLTMQCYAKIGINLPHLASAQANYGTSVSYSDMKKGDLIFFGGSSYSSIYHVAIYIGDGMMIHAENSNTGIVISYVSTFAQYNNITCIKRLI